MLLLILRRQAGWEKWCIRLDQAAKEGPLLICPVVFSECAVGYPDVASAHAAFASVGLRYDNFSEECAWLAGQTFLNYRKNGGPREHLLPDFLVAAHAMTQAERFAALDRGYYRKYFPCLVLLEA